MPSRKTEATELSVGFGLLGQNPLGTIAEDVDVAFGGTVSHEKYENYRTEFASNESYYRRFYYYCVTTNMVRYVIICHDFLERSLN